MKGKGRSEPAEVYPQIVREKVERKESSGHREANMLR